ncbi:MAG: alpha-amylase [Cyanobacteria bacterium J083]|nr:MAG: alpha-amylase [Cyanobacteria bacterium J083]
MSLINGVMMQYFHWYIDPNVILWEEVKNRAQQLAEAGFTALWLPPATKAMGGTYDVGYGIYDAYDLGEFEQKGTVRTKYGDKQQYLAAVKAIQAAGMQVYGDAVLNHRMGGDLPEVTRATPYYYWDRTHPKGEMREIKTYTHFNFPGRQGKYSELQLHWWHFDAVDYDEYHPEPDTIYLLEGKTFDDYVGLEYGNYDFLIGCDLDMQHPEVQQEMIRWGRWYLDTTGVDGFRLDAIKHISTWFIPLWLEGLAAYANKDLFNVGEYWSQNVETLHWYLDAIGGKISLFDIPLHYNLHYASRGSGYYDMRNILDGTLMQQRPLNAVTFVENHDSQPLQRAETCVEPWFKPLAYALILLRREGYPCVFYADYYGAEYEDWGHDGNRYRIVLPSHRWLIDRFLYARRHYAYGEQYDYFDHWDIIGWTRLGDEQHPQAMAVIMSDGPGGSKWMEVAKANTKFIDLTEHIKQPVYTNEWGWGEFFCKGGSVSVWVQDNSVS